MNLWDVLLTAAIVAALALAVISCVRKKFRGGGCCGDCAGCRGCSGQEEK